MNQEQWTAVDDYFGQSIVKSDAALNAAIETSNTAGLPSINVTASQGKFLHLMARAIGARNILEIGTLGGYSTIWLARSLPKDGRLITLELEQKNADVARSNIARAGLIDVVELRLGKALDSLKQLVAEKHAPFDFIFIDADKPGYPDYFTWSMKLARRGTVIIADNVVRKGAVADANTADPLVQGVQRFNELVAAEPRVSATAIQTVGSKGYDGFTMIVVTAD